MERAKQGFDPSGVGMAWTHNFLNQKPWHPMSFKNRMRVWEHEQDKQQADKTKEKAQAEFDAEQEYLKTLSYLSPEEQRRYKEVQSVSFMYTKPPGLDAALARDAEMEKKKATQAEQKALPAPGAASGSGAAPGPAAAGGQAAGGPRPGSGAPGGPAAPPPAAAANPEQQRAAMVDRLREDPYAAMLAARQALENDTRLALRQAEAGAFGGFRADASNQQLLVEEPMAEAAGEGVTAELQFVLTLPAEQQLKALKRIAKRRKKEEEERKLREAEAVLRAAGYDLSGLQAAAAAGGGREGHGVGDGGKHKRKHKKKKKSHKHKDDSSRKSKRRRRDSGSDTDDSSSSRSSG